MVPNTQQCMYYVDLTIYKKYRVPDFFLVPNLGPLILLDHHTTCRQREREKREDRGGRRLAREWTSTPPRGMRMRMPPRCVLGERDTFVIYLMGSVGLLLLYITAMRRCQLGLKLKNHPSSSHTPRGPFSSAPLLLPPLLTFPFSHF